MKTSTVNSTRNKILLEGQRKSPAKYFYEMWKIKMHEVLKESETEEVKENKGVSGLLRELEIWQEPGLHNLEK